MRGPYTSLGLAGFVMLAWSASASAGLFFHRHGHEHEEKPHPTPEAGKARHFCHSHERAGFPLSLRDHVQPTDAGDSYGYYVGGGGGHGSGPRCRVEGTFGWDYVGIHFPRNVILGWNHGRKVQAGPDVYKGEPPVEVPNIFAFPPRPERGGSGEGEH